MIWITLFERETKYILPTITDYMIMPTEATVGGCERFKNYAEFLKFENSSFFESLNQLQLYHHNYNDIIFNVLVYLEF